MGDFFFNKNLLIFIIITLEIRNIINPTDQFILPILILLN